MDWLVTDMEMENLPLSVDQFYGIVETSSPKTGAVGYRFYPDKVKGEGFFLACFRKKTSEGEAKLRMSKPEIITAKERKALEPWIATEELQFVRFRNEITGLPINFVADFSLLQPVLNLQYAGVSVGEVLKEKLVPHHALAQNTKINKHIPATDLSYDDAIKYLQRQELSKMPETIGWQVVRHQDYNLGWINALKHRINNYYPKEIRILKARNDSSFEK
jgi:NOL1/NOP2/fmu family ribosome biogenesis protein